MAQREAVQEVKNWTIQILAKFLAHRTPPHKADQHSHNREAAHERDNFQKRHVSYKPVIERERHGTKNILDHHLVERQ